MDAQSAIRLSIDLGDLVVMSYLSDLSDADLMHRPAPSCNHINWQLGHCIASEHHDVERVAPGSMPPLPAGFAEKYTKETAAGNDAQQFCTKDELLATYQAQRAATLAALAKTSADDLDRATGVDYAPTVAGIYSIQGGHYLMHAGQWAVIRRQLGRPPLF